MLEIRFHGRGGQGVVLASRLVASAACAEGLHVQAFPMFGAERGGAPVTAFLRLSDSPIWLRAQIQRPDVVVVLDETLFSLADVTCGIKGGGAVVANATDLPQTLLVKHADDALHWHKVDACEIAIGNGLGTPTAPLVSTAMAGAVCRVLGNIGMPALLNAVLRDSPTRAEQNVAAAEQAFNAVSHVDSVAHSPVAEANP